MPSYIGVIQEKNNFTNFYPLYEYLNGNVLLIDENRRKNILPESEFGNILLQSDGDIHILSNDNILQDGEYILLEYYEKDLQDNLNSVDGQRQKTGYKIDIKSSTVNYSQLSDLNYYFVINFNDIEGEYTKDEILIIPHLMVYNGLKLVIRSSEDPNIYIGWFEVKQRDIDNSYYIKTSLKDNYSILSGYKLKGNVKPKFIEFEKRKGWGETEHHQFIQISKESFEEYFIDCATDEMLLDNLRKNISNKYYSNDKLDLSNIEDVLNEYNKSINKGSGISLDIRERRLRKIEQILTETKYLNNEIDITAEIIGNILDKSGDSEAANKILDWLSRKTDLLNRITKYSFLAGNIEKEQRNLGKIQQEIEQLIEKKENLEKEITQKTEQEYIQQQTIKISELQNECDRLNNCIKELEEKHGKYETLDRLEGAIQAKQGDLTKAQKRQEEINKEIKAVKECFDESMKQSWEETFKKLVDVSHHEILLQSLSQQTEIWNNDKEKKDYSEVRKILSNVNIETYDNKTLIEYLVSKIQKYRPQYTKNLILNIMICITQGFLTIFSGKPGTGKTSICRIIAHILGLNLPIDMNQKNNLEINMNRFIPISVERGWTTKKDFMGYYNPLTKSFEQNDSHLFDALNILNVKQNDDKDDTNIKLPFVILLDEANLSPMEYYWADFMNLCDELGEDSIINLGNKYRFKIPSNLRFVATINNDHTTEALSPRLIDRAWIIKLPKMHDNEYDTLKFDDEIELISWDNLLSCFSLIDQNPEMDQRIEDIYIDIVNKIKEIQITISHRTNNAIKKYLAVAKDWFEDVGDVDGMIIALDYAIAQRILPCVSGYGKEFENQLTELKMLFRNNNLTISEQVIDDIIKNNELGNYNFFF